MNIVLLNIGTKAHIHSRSRREATDSQEVRHENYRKVKKGKIIKRKKGRKERRWKGKEKHGEK